MAEWYRQGKDGLEEAERIEKEIEARRNMPLRFWLPVGESATLTFLDSAGFYFYEHQVKKDGHWRNWYTCVRDFEPECPLCDAGHQSSYVTAYTVIDHREYVSQKDGKRYGNIKKLFVAKRNVNKKLVRRRDEDLDGDLTFAVLKFTRDTRDDPSTGSDIVVRKKLTREEVLRFKPAEMSEAEWLAPINYIEVFKPLTVDQLRRISRGAAPAGTEEHKFERAAGRVIESAEKGGSVASLDELL